MMTILREDADGTLARLFSTPTSRSFILAGNFLSVILMVTVQALVLLVAGTLLFKVNWGQPASVFIAIIGQVVAATGLGVLLISLVKTTQQAGPVLGGGLTFLGMMGGLFTASVPSMPKIFDMVGQFTPQGWVMKAWKICLAGGAPVDVLLPLAVLIGMGAILFIAGAVIFRRRFV
jgi:ABC-2 type transport system permease protein